MQSTDATGITFTGGTIKVYVDHTPNYDSLLASTASDGDLFLDLAGHSEYDLTAMSMGTLFSTPTPTASFKGNGRGDLDVVGGLAAGNFDTNQINTIQDAAGTIGSADFSFSSSFQLIGGNAQNPGGSTFESDDGKIYGLFGFERIAG